jgi:diaminopimelate epimerase
MRFVKFHGYGNDYLVFEGGRLGAVGWREGFDRFGAGEAFTEFVRRVCDRHFGAGSDGVAVVERLNEGGAADFRLRIFNPDGGEAAMSGNGSRCAASYLHFEGLWSARTLRFETRAGVKLYVLRGRAGETLSSGTGACAAAVASMVGGRTGRHVKVSMPGGLLEVLWREDGEVLLTGEAEAVYRGEWLKDGL